MLLTKLEVNIGNLRLVHSLDLIDGIIQFYLCYENQTINKNDQINLFFY